MPWKDWVRPEPEPSEGGLIGYRRSLLVFLSVSTVVASWLPLRTVMVLGLPTAFEAATAGYGMALAVVTFSLQRFRPWLAGRLYTVGSFILIILVFQVLRQAEVFSFLALFVLLAGLLIGWPAVLPAWLCATLAVLRLAAGPDLSASSLPSLLLIGAAAGIGILTAQGLQLVDHWEREAAVQQREMIVKLRERQGELNRTLKALNEAYGLLKRSHDELAVARQQADEARAFKEQFVANVSHELRTPLSLIVGFAEIIYLSPEIYEGVTWTAELENDIREMYRAGQHLQSLINDILDLSRIDAAKLPMFRELSDIRTISSEAIEAIAPLARQRGLSLEVRAPETLPKLLVDRTRIRQVFLNLLNNAVRFTDRGGITVDFEQREGAVVVSVSDTGVGIPEDQMEHVFEEFRQIGAGPRGRGGTGLGLALSRQFVGLHGGRMWAESRLGVGSTFHFSLPLPGAMPGLTPLITIPYRKQQLDDGPVLFLDPDPGMAEMLRRYLGDRRVLAVRDVGEAERLIEKEHPLTVIVNQSPDAPPDAWLGPLGELSIRYDVPVLRCAIPSPSWLRQATGLDGCLTKPVSQEALSQLLDAYLQPPKRVLVVDDDPGSVRLMCRLLAAVGLQAEIAKAYSGAQALRLARQNVPDLVLLDLLMPEMDGFEVLQGMRGEPALAGTRVIAVTATSYGEEALRRRGGYLTLSQPSGFSAGTVTELLYAVLGIARPRYG